MLFKQRNAVSFWIVVFFLSLFITGTGCPVETTKESAKDIIRQETKASEKETKEKEHTPTIPDIPDDFESHTSRNGLWSIFYPKDWKLGDEFRQDEEMQAELEKGQESFDVYTPDAISASLAVYAFDLEIHQEVEPFDDIEKWAEEDKEGYGQDYETISLIDIMLNGIPAQKHIYKIAGSTHINVILRYGSHYVEIGSQIAPGEDEKENLSNIEKIISSFHFLK